MNAQELILRFIAGALLGMAGQTIRTFVGLTKANAEQQEISLPRLFGSLAIGMTTGGLGIFTLVDWKSLTDISHEAFGMLISMGYAGTDLLEGFFQAFVRPVKPPSSANGPQTPTPGQQTGDLTSPATVAFPSSPSAFFEAPVFRFPESILADPVISFGPNADISSVSKQAIDFLKALLIRSGNSRATITSSFRSPERQAAIMYDNLERFGAAHQKRLYGDSGDLVIGVYEAARATGATKEAILERMIAKIHEIGPDKISKHMGDFSKLVVIDVAPSSIIHQQAFLGALTEATGTCPGFRFLHPPTDPAFHLEIPANAVCAV